MAQKPKKKKPRLPKDIMERSDHDIMEVLLGKRVVKELEKITGRDSEDEEGQSPNQ